MISTSNLNKGGEDFLEINEPKVFDPSDVPRVCYMTIIFSDDLLENTEFFQLSLVNPFQDTPLNVSDTTTVFITDTSSKYTS